jgi:hypothetical protein
VDDQDYKQKDRADKLVRNTVSRQYNRESSGNAGKEDDGLNEELLSPLRPRRSVTH